MAKRKQIVIRAKELFDGKTKQEDVFIVVEDNKIVDIFGKNMAVVMPPDYEGIVTPAFIDAHSHIGMVREGEPSREGETNDTLNQIMPLLNPLDSIYFDDRAFRDAVDFGVLYSCVIPGSGNIVGGRAMIIRNFARNRNEALVKDYGFKMALGFNPRSTTEWKGSRPNTRMGVYALLENTFDNLLIKRAKALLARERRAEELRIKNEKGDISDHEFENRLYDSQREYDLEFSAEENALLEMLFNHDKIVKVHVHKEDDIIYLIGLVKKYNLTVTADHACDVFRKEVFDMLADCAIPVVYGPLGSLDYKVELKNGFYKNTVQLMKSRAFYGLMTDHPVILTTALRDSLKYFLIQGMSEEDAISLITYKNAKILGIDDSLGMVELGKTASLLVWDKNPLHLSAFPKVVIAEGKVLRDRTKK